MVSVIVPVYKVEKYLEECINSIIAQTYKDIEIILVDDGSPDQCPQICDNYAKLDSRIRVIHKENGGLSSARNAGIDIAKGEYLVFVDSDDYVVENKVEQLLFALAEGDADIAVCSLTSSEAELDYKLETSVELYTPAQTIEFILKERKFTTSASGKLYKKHLFHNIRFPEKKIYEDLGTIYKLIDKSERVAFVNSAKYYYRCNDESITQAKFSNKQLDYFVIAKELESYINCKYPQYLRLLMNHSVRISISFMRKISICGFDDANTIKFLTDRIRKNIFWYLFSEYSILSKMYGIAISVSPNIALKFFRNKR